MSSKPLVLVVEDEPLLRLHAVSLLEDAGFDTLQAGSADEAIALLEKDANIQIVFTDIDLPGGMDGMKLAAAVRDRWPPVELVLTSGHIKVRDADLPARGHFLSKPYDAERLINTMQGLVH
ncbi:MAG TPA: response regulator [Burkholderiaceae bacterium]|nr:response regulator [Burkholderiaceae bacterium]